MHGQKTSKIKKKARLHGNKFRWTIKHENNMNIRTVVVVVVIVVVVSPIYFF